MLSISGWLLCVGVAVVVAAPLQKVAVGPAAAANEVQKQEQELQSLLNIADETSGQKDVTVHEESMQQVHEVNGHKAEVDTARKTVSDTATGEVLSDVKQEVVKPAQRAGAVEVKTEVDVPAEGIHETIVQSEPEAARDVETEAQEQVEFSPDAVADYLYRTGDFLRFYSALAQLVNASIMTEEEAEAYSQMVALEYEKLQMVEYENNIVLQRRAPQSFSRYPLAIDASKYPYPAEAQNDFPVAVDMPEAVYGFEQGPTPRDLDIDPNTLLSALWSEAYGSGDARAQALVSELFEKVQTDNDPNDESQVRDVLLDLLSSVMTNDEVQPQYAWQSLVDDDVMPPERVSEKLRRSEPIKRAQDLQSANGLWRSEPIKRAQDLQSANGLAARSEKRAAEQPTLGVDTKSESQEHPIENSHVHEQQPMAASETKTEAKAAQESEPVTAVKAPAQTSGRV